jgi:hypothetical protein
VLVGTGGTRGRSAGRHWSRRTGQQTSRHCCQPQFLPRRSARRRRPPGQSRTGHPPGKHCSRPRPRRPCGRSPVRTLQGGLDLDLEQLLRANKRVRAVSSGTVAQRGPTVLIGVGRAVNGGCCGSGEGDREGGLAVACLYSGNPVRPRRASIPSDPIAGNSTADYTMSLTAQTQRRSLHRTRPASSLRQWNLSLRESWRGGRSRAPFQGSNCSCASSPE